MLKLYIILIFFLASLGNVFCQQLELSSNLQLKLSDKNSRNIFSLPESKEINENTNSLYLKREPVRRKQFTGGSDNVNPDLIGKKYPLWVPIVELVSLHATVCLVSNYILHNQFAKISFKSVAQNFKTGFVWDRDYFVTNYFAHPFNGSLYYNLARSNGYNYWTSSVFAFSGSLTWELFMETEPPATNDIINTTISGIFLGEITHRLSSLLIDERTTGFERVMRELGIGLIDIPRGFNRLFQGRTWEVNRNSYQRKPLALNAYYGVNWNNYGTKIGTGIANGVVGFGLLYGNPFINKNREIMDFFRLYGSFNIGAGQPPVGTLEGYGLLYGKSKKTSEKTNRLFGIFHHYDYYDNLAYEIGAVSFGTAWMSGHRTSGNSLLFSAIHLNIMPLGASKSIYIDTAGQERNYSFSGGLNAMFELSYAGKWGIIYAGYNFYWYHTYVGIAGNELYGILRPKIVINVTQKLGVGVQFLFAHKEGFYKDFESVNGRAYQGMLLLQYKFGDISF